MSDRSTPRAWVTWALLAAVAVLAVLPLATGAGEGMEEPFSGADGQAESLVGELNPDYEPWMAPLVELPSGEVESGLFALQAAIGAGVVGYALGVARTRSRLGDRAAPGRGAPASGPEASDAPGGPRDR